LIFVMLPVYAVSVMSGGPWLVWNDADTGFALAATAYIGIGPTMLGNLFYLYGVGTNGATRAAAFLYLSPLFSAAFSIGWLGEQLAWYHIAGVVAIFAGLALLSAAGHKPRTA
jgi:drug/metabolite transporter (DMT)-like permease